MTKITIERETLEMALAALGEYERHYGWRIGPTVELRAAQPAEPVAWLHICVKPGRREVYATVDPDDNKWWPADQWTSHTVHPLYAAPPAPAAVPPGYALVPIEPTPKMVAAYLNANDEYWKRADELPPSLFKWRNGTPKDATVESYRAMIAAAGDKP